MITLIYVAITAYLLAIVGWNLYRQEKALDQLNCALVLVPLILRLVGLK